MTTAERIRAALESLRPETVDIQDDSAAHVGHAGARDGGGHYHVLVVSACFAGQSRIARHRKVHAALGTLMGSEIHALAIEAYAPGEL